MKNKSKKDAQGYAPIHLNVKKEIKSSLKDPLFKKSFESIKDEFEALDILLSARRASGLTQQAIASKMGIAQSALSRIESNIGNPKHSPTLDTLRKYAQACGKRLEIRLVDC
jgi:DNA-binding XRE family transcriptional regulator